MSSMRAKVENVVYNTDVLEDFNIKEATKEAKIGWIKTLIIIAVWPALKKALLAKLNPRLVQIIDDILNGL